MAQASAPWVTGVLWDSYSDVLSNPLASMGKCNVLKSWSVAGTCKFYLEFYLLSTILYFTFLQILIYYFPSLPFPPTFLPLIFSTLSLLFWWQGGTFLHNMLTVGAVYPTLPSWASPLAEGNWLLMVHNSVALLKLSPVEGSYLAQDYDSLLGQHASKKTQKTLGPSLEQLQRTIAVPKAWVGSTEASFAIASWSTFSLCYPAFLKSVSPSVTSDSLQPPEL